MCWALLCSLFIHFHLFSFFTFTFSSMKYLMSFHSWQHISQSVFVRQNERRRHQRLRGRRGKQDVGIRSHGLLHHQDAVFAPEIWIHLGPDWWGTRVICLRLSCRRPHAYMLFFVLAGNKICDDSRGDPRFPLAGRSSDRRKGLSWSQSQQTVNIHFTSISTCTQNV